MAAIAREEAAAERLAAQSALRQKARRAERVQGAAKRCRPQVVKTITEEGGGGGGGGEQRVESVSSIFRKDSAH